MPLPGNGSGVQAYPRLSHQAISFRKLSDILFDGSRSIARHRVEMKCAGFDNFEK
jgi:hypothetical protein